MVVGVVDRVVVVDRCVAVADLEVFDGFGGVRCELVSASPSSGAASGAGMAKARTEPSARRTTEIGAMNRQRRSRTAAGASGSTAARCSRFSWKSHQPAGRISPAARAAPIAIPGMPRSAMAAKSAAAPAMMPRAARMDFQLDGRE